jgi:hypothetical protein
MPKIRFNLKQLADLGEDIKGAGKAVPMIALKSIRLDFREAKRELTRQIPVHSGATRKTVYNWFRNQRGTILARFGFRTRRQSKETVIAANVLMSGANIRPKNAKSLWIPLPGNVQADGQAIVTPRMLVAQGGFVLLRNVVFKKAPGTAGLEPLFVLRQSITIPARIESPTTIMERRVPMITSNIQELIAQALVAKRAALNALQT